MTTHRKITAILVAKPGKADALERLLKEITSPCRSEAGSLRWEIWQDVDDPARFVLDEVYESDAAIAEHRTTDHFKHYLTTINDLATRTPIVCKPYDVP